MVIPLRSRRPPDPPPGLTHHVSRREAARLLGFASDFPIRQLEKDGRLRAVRGAMGQAWYPREAVLGLLSRSGAPPAAARERAPAPGGPRAAGAWSDAELIALLRELAPPEAGVSGRETGHPRTVVDLVADTGIPILRAARIYRFWLANDRHPTAELARAQAGLWRERPRRPTVPAAGEAQPRSAPDATRTPAAPDAARTVERSRTPDESALSGGERRGSERVERERLIRRLRDPDPAVRALAFEKLRPRRKS